MRWLPFAILAGVGIVCQTTAVQYMRWPGIGPDLMFILAVHYALWGPWPEAAIAGWILGFILDLFTLASGGRIGLHAFCYGAAAWGIIRVRQVVVRNHWMAQMLITLLFALGVEVAVLFYHHWSAPPISLRGGWGEAILRAVYTAVLAPVLLWGLMRLGRFTGLRAEARSRARRRA
jgi:rod shape-determining protein MreD